jgi:hypothetical protein
MITPVTKGETGVIDPELWIRAFVRGTRTTRDLATSWQPWDDFARPIVELRREFGIEPRARSRSVARPPSTYNAAGELAAAAAIAQNAAYVNRIRVWFSYCDIEPNHGLTAPMSSEPFRASRPIEHDLLESPWDLAAHPR